MSEHDRWTSRRARLTAQRALEAFALGVLVLVSASAGVLMKRSTSVPAAVATDRVVVPGDDHALFEHLTHDSSDGFVRRSSETIQSGSLPWRTTPDERTPFAETGVAQPREAPVVGIVTMDGTRVEEIPEAHSAVRYFDGRPVRPARQLWMTVTAYSPDERSCGIWADGITASNKSVWTNAMRLVAADTRILPFGTLLSLDDYADGEIVPVLDRGGAIKGMRLDVLYATHQEALQFGVKRVPVTIWEYAD